MKQGWELKELRRIGKIFSGNSINASVKEKKYLNQPDGLPYIATKDVGYDTIVDYDNGIKIPISEQSSFRVAPKNSILICAEGGSAGRKMGRTNQSICFVNKLFALSVDNETLSKYVFYWYHTDLFQLDFKSRLTGIIGGVAKGKFEKITIPLAPPNEQKQIVAILDQCFEAIDKAKANIERNLNNSKELFQSELNRIFTQKGDGWVEKKWGDICHFVRGPFGGSLKKSMFVEKGYVVYEQKHAIHNHFNQLRYFIDETKFIEMKRFEVKPGDIIMSCSGVTLGRVAVIPDGIEKGIINQALLKLTPHENVSVHFLKYWLRSKIFQDIILKQSGGAAIPNVPSAKILKEIILSLPALVKQEEIVNKIDLIKTQTKTLESHYKKELDALDELKKSILQKAFNGELTSKEEVAA